jgi:hypothetical protein
MGTPAGYDGTIDIILSADRVPMAHNRRLQMVLHQTKGRLTVQASMTSLHAAACSPAAVTRLPAPFTPAVFRWLVQSPSAWNVSLGRATYRMTAQAAEGLFPSRVRCRVPRETKSRMRLPGSTPP